MPASSPEALFLLPEWSFQSIYGEELKSEISQIVSLYPHRLEGGTYAQHLEACASVRMIFSGWGMAQINADFLKTFPKLEILLYGAGSVKGAVTPESWDRGVRVTNAIKANAIPVAEYALAQILFSLKKGWQHAADYKKSRKKIAQHEVAGAYGSTVGLLSLGTIGRLMVEHLRRFEVKIVAYDPFIKPEAAEKMGVKLASLEEVFKTADVVSCHTPWLPETVGLLKGHHFLSMKPGATFINTARGAVVNEPELIAALQKRPDLFAILDVTWPEPPPEDSLFYDLPNVIITPHIAGSMGQECRRMGSFMIEDAKRFLKGEPLLYEINREQAAIMA